MAKIDEVRNSCRRSDSSVHEISIEQKKRSYGGRRAEMCEDVVLVDEGSVGIVVSDSLGQNFD